MLSIYELLFSVFYLQLVFAFLLPPSDGFLRSRGLLSHQPHSDAFLLSRGSVSLQPPSGREGDRDSGGRSLRLIKI